jgi:two-component system CitB family sensor kinase
VVVVIAFTQAAHAATLVGMRLRRWSLARQLLALQLLLLGVLLGVGGTSLFLETRSDTQDRARDRVTDLARSVAVSPYVQLALEQPRPADRLQPYAEQVRAATGVDFVVVMAPDRTRYSHPNASLIGKPFIGSIAPALAGRTFTETTTGTLGPSVRAVSPVRDDSGQVVGLVAVGITTDRIGDELVRQLPAFVLVGLLAAGIAVAGAWLVSRRLRLQTHGMGSAEITRMYEYYDAVLHSVREGLVLIDRERNVQLVNDEGRRLLGVCKADLEGLPAAQLTPSPTLGDLFTSGRAAADEIHLTGDRILVVNQTAARWEGRTLGTVATLRDHTDLQALSGELDSLRGFSESLRSQAHEAANRLHTVVSLIELGRSDEALEFATSELELAQDLTDRLLVSVEEPVLSALLLGKVAQASERGVEIDISPDTAVAAVPLPPRDLVTLVGNLIDNAIDAAAEAPPPRKVVVTLAQEDGELLVRVSDTGPGLDAEQAASAFERGWSTKPATSPHGRGLGLALVGQVVRRYGGQVEVTREVGAVFTVRLPLRPTMELSDRQWLETR